MTELYPWLNAIGRDLSTRLQANRLPHALLLVGGQGVGVQNLVSWLEAGLLCTAEPTEKPCGQCRGCRLRAAGNHADTMHLVPEGKAGTIRVDAVRGLLNFSQGTPQLSDHQVVVIENAHTLNLAASNALLKVLEEPPAGTYLILQTDDPSRLLPTIRSRVQWVRCPQPQPAEGLTWLQAQLSAKSLASDQAELLLSLADGRPCDALAMAEPDYLQRRTEWLNTLAGQLSQPSRSLQGLADLYTASPEHVLSTWQQWLVDVARLQQTGNVAWVRNQDEISRMQSLIAQRPSPKLWMRLYEQVQALQQQVMAGNNLNWQLLLENFWLRIPREIKQNTPQPQE